MARGKAAKWMSFATPQQPPTSSTVAHDSIHSTLAIADEKQFGLENVRDLRLGPILSSDLFLRPVSLETLGSLSLPPIFLPPFSTTSPVQLRQLGAPSTLLLLPLPRPRHTIYGHLCTTHTRHRFTTDTPTTLNRYLRPPASQIRPRQARARRPACSHHPNPRHPLSAPHPLLCPPLPVRVHFQEPSR
jgi:hypothetical protein